MPEHRGSNEGSAHLRQNPVRLPCLNEQLTYQHADDADVEQIDARELLRPRGIRELELHELLGEVLGPHHDAVGEDTQRKKMDEHPAVIRDKNVGDTGEEEDHHPDADWAGGFPMPCTC